MGDEVESGSHPWDKKSRVSAARGCCDNFGKRADIGRGLRIPFVGAPAGRSRALGDDVSAKKRSQPVSDPAPRKSAGTVSAQALVDAVVAAAGELLVEHGPSLTTNDVASRAGVSIGSLYQYFPNKEAILAEATRRVNESFRAQLRPIVEGTAPAPDQLDAVLELACSDRYGDLKLRRALLQHVPRAWSHTLIADSESAIMALLSKLGAEIVRWRSEKGLPLPPPETDGSTIAFFMVRGAIQGALLYRPDLLLNNRLMSTIRPHVHALFAMSDPSTADPPKDR